MQRLFVLPAIIGAALASVPAATAQAPANDLFANAITLNGPIVTATGSNVGATKQFGGGGGEPSIGGGLGNFGGASVWWQWTATAGGPTTIDTEGSSFNTLLGAFTGVAQNALTLVAGNDDFEGNPWSKITFNAVAGTTYNIMVDGFRSGPGFGSPATGSIVLHVKGVGGLNLSLANGSVFTFGEPIPVTISFTPDYPNGPASRAEFYRQGSPFTAPVLVSTDNEAPFSAVIDGAPAGSNSVYAVTFDSLGNPVASPVVSILVQNVGATLLTPYEDTVFPTTAPITVNAWGYLPSGNIAAVDFLVDGVKFAESTTPPYSGTWSNVTGGSHRFTAVARSESGSRHVSQAVNIGVVTTLLPFNSVWKYLDTGVDQGTAWYASDFDDSTWASGPAPHGYADSNGRFPATTNSFGADANNKYPTTYFRQSVNIADTASFSSVRLNIERDDGAIIYLNGVELTRFNMPTGTVTYATFAASNANDDGGTVFTFNMDRSLLRTGVNVFAVEIHNDAANSSDIWFQMSLTGQPVIIHNLSPEIALTAPANGSFFLAPTEVALAATASDADGSVTKVEFFVDGAKIGEDTEAPYTAVWNNPTIAAHTLTAVATDDQGATTTSEEILAVAHDAVGTPVGKVTAPPDGHIVEGPTNMVVTATANATNNIVNVQFLANGVEYASDAVPPYSAIWPAPFGTNILTVRITDDAGAIGISPDVTVIVTVPPTNVIAPTVFLQTPIAGATVTNLTSVNVLFSERVLNVNASDLLINGVPALAMTSNGSLTNYTFTFTEPAVGTVNITWAADHGITDYGYPENLPFDGNGPGATWTYNYIDKRVPVVTARTPTPGAIVTNLTEIRLTFSEPVSGVDAGDLLINGTPALAMTGGGVSYTFTVPTPPSSGTSLVSVTWTTNSGIFDLAAAPNAFVGTQTNNTWRFTYDPRATLVQSNSTWLFIKGFAEASEPMNAWRSPGFDDSGWSNSAAPFFFGDPYTNANNRGTLLSDMNSNYTSIYLRKEFNVENRGAITALLLNHQSDDGFIAWINGFEVLRYNVPSGANGDLPYNTNASAAATEPGNAGAAYIVAGLTNAAVSRLVNGRNVLAIHAFNQSLTNSSDFGFNAHLYFFPVDPTTVPPRVVAVEPGGGDIFYLTNITFSFTEPVGGVDAADLLINGTPAASVTSTTNSTYTFHFPQPAYGPVAITWDTNHAIVDFDATPRAFDGNAAASRVNYVLLNPSSPRIATRTPAPNTVLTGLTLISVTFDEPVTGVNASDFLVSGAPASSVSTSDSQTYLFNFTQPPFGAVTIRWATNHGITDLEAVPAPFDPTRFGGQWNYTLIDPVPTITLTSPTNNTFFLPPARITVRATASDNDGSVALIELFGNGTKLGETNASPFSLTLSNLEVGSYTFTGIVSDNQGLQRTSAPVVINVVTSLPISLVRGPYLNSGSPTGGVIRWRTSAVSDGLVYYGTDPDHLTNVARELSITNEHIVKLTDLQPDTKYYYSIGSAAYRLVGGTNDGQNYWLDTLPAPGTRRPYRFWVLGDAGTAGLGDPARQQSVRDAFLNFTATDGNQPDAWLMLGDNAYNSGTDAEHQAAVFDMYPSTLRNKFLWPTIGNHETAQSTTATDFPYLNIFSLPVAGESGGVPSGTEKYYSFDHGNIHFVCLDSMTSGQTATTPMANWLRSDLEATTAEWVIVFFHHPPYTKGSHNSDTEQDLVQIRQNLVPILESYGVDLVLSGHSHCYERSVLLNGHYGLAPTLTPSMQVDGGDGREDGDGPYQKDTSGQGTVYTVAGSSGQATFLQGDAPHTAMNVTLLELGSMVIDVSGNRLDGMFLRENGLVQDHFTITKPSPTPMAPQDLVAIPTNASDVSLSWTDAAVNELGYSVERSTDGINFVEIQALDAGSTGTLDAGLPLGATFYYRVRGTNTVGTGDYSAIASVTLTAPTSLPAAPGALAVNPDDGVNHFRSQMVLRWQDRSTNEAAFQIERSSDGLTFVPAGTVAANVNTFIDRHLASATFYYYRIFAVNALGKSAGTPVASNETHPQTQIAREGETVTLHAGVEGGQNLRYQWRYMGTPISGATNEALHLASVEAPDEGEYNVIIRDDTSRISSNPAYVFVLSPPRLLTQPEDVLAVAGNSVTFAVTASGSEPMRYQWRRNGTLLGGATSPTLTLPAAQLSDRGGYYLTVENDFGSVTSRVATLDVFLLPDVQNIPGLFAEVLEPIAISVIANDANVPRLNLVYALASGAPTNASVHPTRGIFRWTPTRAQAATTNLFTVIATDATRAFLTSSNSFEIRVNDYAELTLGSTTVIAGNTSSVPVDIVATKGLQNARFQLQIDPARLGNVRLESLLPGIANGTLQSPVAGTYDVELAAQPDQSLVGTQRIAMLYFTALPGQLSSFVPLHVGGLHYITGTEGPEPTHLANNGRAAVLGTQSLLEARLRGGIVREITLYGRTGVTYTVETSTNMLPGTWTRLGTTTTTSNLSRTLGVPAGNIPTRYYRSRP